MTRKIALAGLMIAVALVLSYFERMIPVPSAVPGVKLGLANIIILVALYLINPAFAFFVQLGRIFLAGFMFGGFTILLYSLAGGLLSLGVMTLLYKIKKPVFSIVGISVAGGVFHNIGQIAMASVMVRNVSLAAYLPVLMISGCITGVFVGFVSRFLIVSLGKTGLFGGKDGYNMEKL